MHDFLQKMIFQKNMLYPPSGWENNVLVDAKMAVWIALSVWGIAIGWTVQGYNPEGGKTFHAVQTNSCNPPSLFHIGQQVFPRGKTAKE